VRRTSNFDDPVRGGRAGRGRLDGFVAVSRSDKPQGGSAQGHSSDVRASLGELAAQTVKSRRGGQVSRTVIEQLAGKSSRFTIVGGFSYGDPGSSLNDAVESAPLGPWSAVAPGAEVDDDQARVGLGEMIGVESKAFETSGAVSAHDNVGLVKEMMDDPDISRLRQVETGASFGQQGVGNKACGHVRLLWWIDP
jgi:hypothetical protein